MFAYSAEIRRLDQRWNLRRVAAFALPALLLGLILRVMLMVHMPYGSFHPDSADLLSTPDNIFNHFHFGLHPKKTFLTPVIHVAAFCIPGVPAMVLIPIIQHLIGLLTVVVIALLCRFWFRHWEWIIIPATVLVAINPALIWYEHALMTETQFVACTALLALAGTLYVLHPCKQSFVGLCVALVLEAGARPEGKLLFAFGFLLVFLVAWPHWRKALRPMAILLMVAIPTVILTRTSQAGILLYTSVLRLSPDQSWFAPGIENYTAEIRQDLRRDWEAHPSYPHSSKRRAIGIALSTYLKDHHKRNDDKAVEKLSTRLAMEICLRRISEIPMLIVHKLKETAVRSPSEEFAQTQIGRKQEKALANAQDLIMRNAKALVGQPLKTPEEVDRFFDSAYAPDRIAWFNRFADWWTESAAAYRTSDITYPDQYIERGVPIYMLVGCLALLLMMIQKPWQFHFSWSSALICLLLVVLLTANVRPRFRLFFEPFWILPCGVFIEILFSNLKRLKKSA